MIRAVRLGSLGFMFGLGSHLELVRVGEELGVAVRFLEVRDEQLHGFYRRERVQHSSQHPDSSKIFFRNRKFFLSLYRSAEYRMAGRGEIAAEFFQALVDQQLRLDRTP